MSKIQDITPTSPALDTDIIPVAIAGSTAKATRTVGAILSLITASTIKSLLGITTLSGSNTGDQDLTGLVHSNRTALDAVSGTNTGDQSLAGLGALNTVQTWTAAQQGEVTALSVSANAIAISLAASNNFSVTLQATTGQTLSAPIDVVAGQSGVIAITQNTTPSTLAYNAFWKFSSGVVPVVSTGANAVDIFTYYVIDANKAICSLIKGVA